MRKNLLQAQREMLASGLKNPGHARQRIAQALGRELTPSQMGAVLDTIMQMDPELMVPRIRQCAEAAAPDEYTVRLRSAVRYDWLEVGFDVAGLFAPPPQGTAWFGIPRNNPDPVAPAPVAQKTLAQTNNEGQNGMLSGDSSFRFTEVRYGIRLVSPPAVVNGQVVGSILDLIAQGVGVNVKVGSTNVDPFGLPPLYHLLQLGASMQTWGDLANSAGPGVTLASVAGTCSAPFRLLEPLEVPAGQQFQCPLEFDVAKMQGAGAQADFIGARVAIGCEFRGVSAVTVLG